MSGIKHHLHVDSVTDIFFSVDRTSPYPWMIQYNSIFSANHALALATK